MSMIPAGAGRHEPASPANPLLLLLADDAGTVHDEIGWFLEEEGFRVRALSTLEATVEALNTLSPDGVLISLEHHPQSKPLVRRIRRATSAPILILKTPDGQSEALDLIDCGADDFVCRIIDAEDELALREMRVRLSACLRRHGPRPGGSIDIGSVVIDPVSETVHRGGSSVDLSKTEYRLLLELCREPGVARSHEELLTAVWSDEKRHYRSYLRTYVSRLRSKLGWQMGREGPQIRGIRDRGYRLDL